tara:strand:- start:707 stop:1525 length:819 start_codon:yes stop_codon:yes gene_type:complete
MPTFEINTVGLDKHVEDTLRAEVKKLKEENKKLKGQVEKNLERNRDLKDFRSVCDALSLPELTDDCLMEYINEKNDENKKLKKENESLALLVKGSDSLDVERRKGIQKKKAQIEGLDKEVKELTERVTDLQNISRTYKKELDLEHMRYVKSKEELYETILDMKNPVTNYDERCGVVRVRCNHAYLMGFMYRHSIDEDEPGPRSIDQQEEFDGVLEHMSKEVENVIDTYLQDSLIYGTQMTLNEVIREKLDDIIDQAIDDGIVKEIDDSSDED